MCCVRYQVCSDTDSFTLDTDALAAGIYAGTVDTMCSDDYVYIENSTPVLGQTYVHHRYCGNILAGVPTGTVDNPVYGKCL